MKCVETLNEIIKNISVLDAYLDRKRDPEYSFALDLVKKGTCFIARRTECGYRFYPSRFIGYANNTMHKHLNNTEKDGKETNPAISDIIHQKPVQNSELEQSYREYCSHLGFTAYEKGTFGVRRKYWLLSE